MSIPSVLQVVRRIQEHYQEQLMRKKNVVGVATGYKNQDGTTPAVVVLVQEKKPIENLSQNDLIPREIDGIRTDVVEVGRLVALGDMPTGDAQSAPHLAPSPRYRHRPLIPAGVSLGHYQVTAGTLGALVHDRTTGERFLLSNNHVLANSNEANIGDSVIQPSRLDGGQNPTDKVAELAKFLALAYLEGDVMPANNTPAKPSNPFLALIQLGLGLLQPKPAQTILFPSGQDNAADAALARPVDHEMFTKQVRGIGNIRQTAPPTLGMKIRKTGRTTDTTQSTITLLNATVSVAYNTSKGPRNARFTGQVICDAFSQGGDSGALVVDATRQAAVGLLFAGSGLASIFTPIDVVLNTLNVNLEV